MQLNGKKLQILTISIVLLFLQSCTSTKSDHQATVPVSLETNSGTAVPSQLSQIPSGDQSTPNQQSSTMPSGSVVQPALTQPPTTTETPTTQDISWRDVPIMPDVSQHVLQIYQDGQAQGRNPNSFSVIGDCQSIPFVFMGPYGQGTLAPDNAESYLWDTINQFKDSINRWSVTSRGGFTAASILNPLQADPHYCESGETPLTCEYRLNNPAFVFITLETWLDPNSIDRYETYLRQILDYVISHGSVPILFTKADSAEVVNGKYVINPAIVKAAQDYDVPVVNFWRAAQYLSNAGIDPARDGFHLSQDGYNLKNILALRALYTVTQAVQKGSANTSNGNTSLTSPNTTPSPQTTSAPESTPQVLVPDCTGGCIYFATAASQDGVITPQGVFAYNYVNHKLTMVLGKGFDLQDVSKDSQRLLVNNNNKLYEINLADASASLIDSSFFSMGKQDAYWNSDDSKVISIDQDHPFQTGTGGAFNLFPSILDNETYFEAGSCTAKDVCQPTGTYLLNSDQKATALDSYSKLVFSPDGNLLAFLNPTAANKDNYFHIGYLMMEEPDKGISSRRVFYFPEVRGFMIYPDVREYAFSSDSKKLFILYDVYSAYFEKSLRIQTYMLDVGSGILYDYGKINGVSGSLAPRLVWAPQGDRVLFFLTDFTSDNQYTLNLFQTTFNSDQRLVPYDQGILTSKDYFYITNIFWR